MRIFINGRFLTQRTTGIQRFAYQMCVALYKKGIEFEVIAPDARLAVTDIPFKVIKYGKNTSPLWEQIWLPLILRKYPDALLISFSGLGPVFRRNHVSTIHDLSFYVNKSWFSTGYRIIYSILTPIMAKRCKHLITVSQFSKREIVRLLGVREDKISVIYNATSEVFRTPKSANEAKPCELFNSKYILAVSSLDPRKNFQALIKAFNMANLPGYKLYIIGGQQRSFASDKTQNDDISNIEFLGHIDDDTLVQAYRHASLFVYPSLYEGFGIPPIEAMSLRCPVAVSDIEVFHEVYGDSAWYFSPTDISDIASKLEYLTNPENSERVMQKVEAGRLKYKEYSWDNSAAKLIKELELK